MILRSGKYIGPEYIYVKLSIGNPYRFFWVHCNDKLIDFKKKLYESGSILNCIPFNNYKFVDYDETKTFKELQIEHTHVLNIVGKWM